MIEVRRDPGAVFNHETGYGPLRPVICGSCGFVEFDVDHPKGLADPEADAIRRQRSWPYLLPMRRSGAIPVQAWRPEPGD